MGENPFAPPTAAIDHTSDEEVGLQVSIVCSSCGGNVRLGESACSKCRRPLTRNERRALQTRWQASDRAVAAAVEETFWGRVSMAAAAVIASLHLVLVLPAGVAVIQWSLGVSLALWVLFGLSFKIPLAASAAALILYAVWWLGQIVLAPLLAFDGFLLRVIVLSALIAGVGAEARLRRRRRALVRLSHTRE